jgi:Tol biopolymer transport system component
MRLGLGVAATLIAALATGCSGHEHSPGTIVFQSDRSGEDANYAVRLDGSGLTRLPRWESFGVWTRDGRRAVVMDTLCSNCPVVIDRAGHTRRNLRLPDVEQISDMPWSPDGTRLVLGTPEGDIVIEVETGVRFALSDQRADDYLTWSPDGKRLLFSSGRDLYTVPADGGPPTRLLRLAGVHDLSRLEWSSDGSWISFMEFGAFRNRLSVVRSNGKDQHLLTRDAATAAWSPTGERLLFAGHRGIFVVDLEKQTRRRLIKDDESESEGPSWSPDGEGILFSRSDLGFEAASGYHTQLWTMKADGTEQRPVTQAFPGDGSMSFPQWIDGTLKGAPVRRLPLVSLRAFRTLVTRLPIASLGAEGSRAAVAQGFGGIPEFHGPLGPIIVWDPVRKRTAQVPVASCGRAYDVILAAGVVGYRCNHPSEAYTVHDALRLGTAKLVHTHGEEFGGSFLGGIAADRGEVAFDVEFAGKPVRPEFHIHQTRIWKSTEGRQKVVGIFGGEATVESLDADRIAVLRGQHTVSVLSPGGAMRTFGFGRRRIFGAALDGARLAVLQSGRLVALDLGSGRRTAWPLRRGLGSEPPDLQGARGGLVAYVAGAAIHILRLSDGREIVIDTPKATEPVFARFVPSGLFYSFNESYASRPGRLLFVTRAELERALDSRAASR